MAILNYTTTISTDKTASEIQRVLAKAGASSILFEYSPEAFVSAISFRIETKQGNISFRLPANTDGVLSVLLSDIAVPRKLKTREQAARVSWRILKVWVEAQLAIVSAEMVTMTEVFLPYAQNSSGKTVYQALADSGFKALTDGSK